MAKQTIIGSDTVRDALVIKGQVNDDELYAHGPLNDPVTADVTYISTLAAAILQANLVDKTADEIISGLKNFTTTPQITAVDWAVAADVENLPVGAIIVWTGTIASVPSGWAICDGVATTPDLSSKFIRGAEAAQDPGGTGGANSINLVANNLPQHNHTGTTITNVNHDHGYSKPISATLLGGSISADTGGSTQQTGSGGAHTHVLTVANTGSGSSIDNRPAYYTVLFIKRTS